MTIKVTQTRRLQGMRKRNGQHACITTTATTTTHLLHAPVSQHLHLVAFGEGEVIALAGLVVVQSFDDER